MVMASEVHSTLAMYPCAKQNKTRLKLWVLTNPDWVGDSKQYANVEFILKSNFNKAA
jgi:hypothetical protein